MAIHSIEQMGNAWIKRLYQSLVAFVAAGCVAETADHLLVTYECQGAREATVEFRDGGVALTVDDGERRLLGRVRSASGAKYSDGKSTFWTKGDEAIVNLGDENLQGCKVRN